MKQTSNRALILAVLGAILSTSAFADPAALAAKADVDHALATINDMQVFFAAMKQRQDSAQAAYNASIAAQPGATATTPTPTPAQ